MNEYLLFTIQVIAWWLLIRYVLSHFPLTTKAIKDLFCKHKTTITLSLENNGKITMTLDICNNCKKLIGSDTLNTQTITELQCSIL